MKGLIKVFFISVIAVFLLAACSTDEPEYEESPYIGKTFTVANEQVWEARGGKKLSETYFKSSVSVIPIMAEVAIMDATKPINENPVAIKPVGVGIMNNGILDISVPQMKSGDLQSWENFLYIPGIGDHFKLWNDLEISDPDVNLNIMLIMFINASNGSPYAIDRERLFGDRVSLGWETILYIYVDRDCRITGTYGDSIVGSSYGYTAKGLDLRMKEGWNMVCEKQVLGFSGKIAFSLDLKNPQGFRWVMLENTP